jgi:Flp pilus assembly pilin Flp
VFSNIRRLRRRSDEAGESGQTLVEYTLILMVVALLTIVALESIGLTVQEFITDAATGVGGGA